MTPPSVILSGIGSGEPECDAKSKREDDDEAGENAEDLHRCETPAVIGWS